MRYHMIFNGPNDENFIKITKMNVNLFIILFIYSLIFHLAAAVAATKYFKKCQKAVTINFEGKVKVSYARIVSLSGRKGNTYDRGKMNIKIDPEKIKNCAFINEKYDFDIVKTARYASFKITQIASKLKTYKSEIKKHESIIKKDVLSVKKNKISKDNHAPIIKNAKINESKNAGATQARGINSRPEKYSSSDNAPEIYGNMSGNESGGEKLAGTPDGLLDPSIEASRIDIFKSIVSEKIIKNMIYPQRCRKYGIEGKVRLSFEIGRNGMIKNIEIIKSSGDSELDSSSIEAVKKSQPFLPFPEEINKNIIFAIPLNYNIRS